MTAFDIKADVLVSLALIASMITGEIFAAGEVAFIMQLGALLEDLTVARARSGIERLVKLTPRTARVLTAEGERVVPAEEVREGDVLRVLPGETIPVDGVITLRLHVGGPVRHDRREPAGGQGRGRRGLLRHRQPLRQLRHARHARGRGQLDTAHGPPRPVGGRRKAKIVGLADRWATWIVVIALSAAAITWLVTGEVIRAVTILVVFCPCALVLATPTAIMAAIGNATKHASSYGRGTRSSASQG